MGITRVLCRMPAIVAVLVFLFCIGLSTWNWISFYKPKVEDVINQAIGQYDTLMPEVKIEKGKASIEEKQPFYLNDDPEKGPIVVIDTRPEAQQDIVSLSRESDKFVGLTQDFLVVKDEKQDRILPLAGIPDVTVNSEFIDKFKKEFYPIAVIVTSIAIVVRYLLTKLTQILILALFFFWLTQKSAAPPTYGQSFKVASFALVVPVLMDMYLFSLNITYLVSWSAYLVIYLAVLAIAYWDFTNTSSGQMDRRAPINP